MKRNRSARLERRRVSVNPAQTVDTTCLIAGVYPDKRLYQQETPRNKRQRRTLGNDHVRVVDQLDCFQKARVPMNLVFEMVRVRILNRSKHLAVISELVK